MNTRILKTVPLLLVPALGTLALAGFWNVRVAQAQQEVQEQEKAQAKPAILAKPMDFSSAPEITAPIDGPSPSEIEASIEKGVRFLLGAQNPDGSFGSHVSSRPGEIYAPLPGSHHAFRAATTSLSVSALVETRGDDKAAAASIDAAEKWMLENFKRVKRAQGDTIYNVWAHAYGIQALVRLRGREGITEARIAQIDELLDLQVKRLVDFESVDGGWGYYDFNAQGAKPTGSSISFVNGTVLIAFKEAADVGIEIPQKIVDRAVASIKRQQKPDFTYLYGEYLKHTPMRGINRPGGSLGRSQVCNLGLRLWEGDEQITDNVLKAWLYRLYLRNGWLDIGRKRPVPHEAWMQVAGYFYYYGHYYAGLCIDQLKPEDRAEYRAMLSKILIKHQEPNGCWWDYTLYSYHQEYGTAFALMSMQRCLEAEKEKKSPDDSM